MGKRTDKTPALAVVADGCAPSAGDIGLLARTVAACGYGADFARRQRQDREVWGPVADEMDRLAAAGGTR